MSDRIHECPRCHKSWHCIGCHTQAIERLCDECATNGNGVPDSASVVQPEVPAVNPKVMRSECCHAQCDSPAEFSIHWGGGADQNTLACIEHVGHLMMPGVPNTVYEYPSEPVGT